MTTTPASAANERDLFETEYARLNKSTPGGGWNDFDSPVGKYAEVETQDAWCLWQAARAIPQPAAEPVKTEGWLIEWRHPGGRKDYAFHRHNAVGDYRAHYGDATAYELVRRAPDRAPSTDSAADGMGAERWRDLLAAVVREMPHRFPSKGNAPGHAHSVPGIWDSDNGAKAGTECAWCLVWKSATEAIAAMQPKGDAA